MLRNLKKLLAADEPPHAQAQMTPRARALNAPLPSSGGAAIASSILGQTLVVTIPDADFNAARAAEINHDIRRLFELNPRVRSLVIDMENVKYLDSAGLNAMVDLISVVRPRGGTIAVAAACQQVEVLFKLTRLELIFKIRRTSIEAIDAVERAA